MSLSLYMDVHVRAAITQGLRQRGIPVLTAQEDGTTQLSDPQLLDRASALGRVLFTNDVDLLAEAHQRQVSGQPFEGWFTHINNTCPWELVWRIPKFSARSLIRSIWRIEWNTSRCDEDGRRGAGGVLKWAT